MKTISTDLAPKAVGPYSQGIMVDGFLFISGQIAINPETGLIEGNIEVQAKQAFENVGKILEAAGMSFKNVVKTTLFLKNISEFSYVNEIYSKYFISNPARSCVEVSYIPKNSLIEIEVIAKK
ncbi:MAG: RidA family protein [Acholeplasmatales bacterium]|nr:RidA family protein [Acholeplasmatales bacterium]